MKEGSFLRLVALHLNHHGLAVVTYPFGDTIIIQIFKVGLSTSQPSSISAIQFHLETPSQSFRTFCYKVTDSDRIKIIEIQRRKETPARMTILILYH